MTECPQCGSALPEKRAVGGTYAPVWALCRRCAWPLNRETMIERLLANRAEVTAVVVFGRDSSGMRTLTGGEAEEAVAGLVGEAEAVAPVCESAGMLAFQRSGLIEFFLFDGESVQHALSAMAGR